MKKASFKRHIALPTDHGSWVFILSPLMIGLYAGRTFSWTSLLLLLGVMMAFLIRQPVTVLVKVFSGRRGRTDLPAALTWITIYGLMGLAALVGLILQGYAFLLLLALPGVLVFMWHLFLVSQRSERRQAGVEIVATGVLALAAPAAYWVALGYPDATGWWLFALAWLQSAASIVYAYLRLTQRELPEHPGVRALLMMGRRALAYTTFNLLSVLILGFLDVLPAWLFLPYLLQWLETMWGTLNPAIRLKPTRIGIRQLIVSTLFTILFILTWNI